MPRFNYVALDARGQEASGLLEAASSNAAIGQLRQAGYFPTSVIEEAISSPDGEQASRSLATSARVKKPRAKKAPPRLYARWGVFNGSMKQVAIFDYSQRAAAAAKLADLLAKNKGSHFLQIVKEPMPEPPPETPAVA